MRRPDRCIPPCIIVASLPAEPTGNSIEIYFINISGPDKPYGSVGGPVGVWNQERVLI